MKTKGKASFTFSAASCAFHLLYLLLEHEISIYWSAERHMIHLIPWQNILHPKCYKKFWWIPTHTLCTETVKFLRCSVLSPSCSFNLLWSQVSPPGPDPQGEVTVLHPWWLKVGHRHFHLRPHGKAYWGTYTWESEKQRPCWWVQ